MDNPTEVAKSFIEHHGVLGMKWGVRRARPSAVTVSQKGKKLKTSGGFERKAARDAITVAKIGQIKKKSGVVALSNQELQAYQQRLNLEQNVKRIDYARSNPAKKFVLGILGQTGKNVVTSVATEEGTKRVKKLLARGAVTAVAAAV